MITIKQQREIEQSAEELLAQQPDWVTFYRQTLGLGGIVRHACPTPEMLAAFEQTEAYQHILRQLAMLRGQRVPPPDDEETRVITIRLPKSMHETLREEAHEHRTSMNQLCISKLLQLIDVDKTRSEP